MNPRIVMVAYKPKTGMENTLKELVKSHHARLKEQDLVTDRTPIMMQSQDGTIIEVFEWKSLDAIQQAHTNKVVGEMWAEFAQVCDYTPIGKLSESADLFANYTAIN